MTHSKHLWRAVLILVLLAAGYLLGRPALVPNSFGVKGYYRYDTLQEVRGQPVVYGGVESCVECHEDQVELRAEGMHKAVSCDVCHGPAAPHAKGEDKTADMPIDRTYELCLTCHRKLPARAKEHAQIVFKEHIKDAIEPGEEVPLDLCISCHDPHEADK